jgi:hypothetical protein
MPRVTMSSVWDDASKAKPSRMPHIPPLEPRIARTSTNWPFYSLFPIPCLYASQGFTNEDAISSKCLTLRVASFA